MHSKAAIHFLWSLIVPVLLKDEFRSPFQTSSSGLLQVGKFTSKPIMIPSSRPMHFHSWDWQENLPHSFLATQSRQLWNPQLAMNCKILAATPKAAFHSVTLEK